VTNFFAFVVCFRHISLWDDAFVLSRESNKINKIRIKKPSRVKSGLREQEVSPFY
jgi:hypothetical protein